MNDEKWVCVYLTAGKSCGEDWGELNSQFLLDENGDRTDSIPEDGCGNFIPVDEGDEVEDKFPPRLSHKRLQRLTRAEQVAYARQRQRGHA